MNSLEMKRIINKLLSRFFYIEFIRIRPIEQKQQNYRAVQANAKYGLVSSVCQINKVIDIGANIGQFASSSSLAFNKAHYHCFEPIKAVFEELKTNLINQANFNLYNIALGNETGIKKIHINNYSPSSSILEMSELHKTNFEYTRNYTVSDINIDKLDSFITNIEPTKNTLVKIDVQGFEQEVIAGGTKFLKECGVIIVEMSFQQLYKDQPLFHDIYMTLYKLGYRYCGNIEQLSGTKDQRILQADCLFFNSLFYNV